MKDKATKKQKKEKYFHSEKKMTGNERMRSRNKTHWKSYNIPANREKLCGFNELKYKNGIFIVQM